MQDIRVPPSLGRSDRTELHRTPRPRRNSTIRWMGLVTLDSASFWFVASWLRPHVGLAQLAVAHSVGSWPVGF